MKPLRSLPLAPTPAPAAESAVALSDTLNGNLDTYQALLATGMDQFEAIAPAVQGDRILAAQLWLKALRLVDIPAGTFKMGATNNKDQFSTNEGPQHLVTIERAFQMGAVQITQGAWETLMGSSPSVFRSNSNLPAEQVSWDDICSPDGFLERLNALTEGVRPPGTTFRLPSEAEWEYACRAGSTTTYSFGDDPEAMADYGWFEDNGDNHTHPVGQKKPNAWGLYDLHGNVWEWCADGYHYDYQKAPKDGSAWTKDCDQSGCVIRGGSWDDGPGNARSACRDWYGTSSRYGTIGFRLVLAEVS